MEPSAQRSFHFFSSIRSVVSCTSSSSSTSYLFSHTTLREYNSERFLDFHFSQSVQFCVRVLVGSAVVHFWSSSSLTSKQSTFRSEEKITESKNKKHKNTQKIEQIKRKKSSLQEHRQTHNRSTTIHREVENFSLSVRFMKKT